MIRPNKRQQRWCRCLVLCLYARERLLTLFHNTQHTSLSLSDAAGVYQHMVLGVPFYAQTCLDSCPKRGTTSGTHGPPFAQFNSLTRREGMPSRFEEGSKEGEPGHYPFLSSLCIQFRTPPCTILFVLSCPLSRGPLEAGKEGRRERRNKNRCQLFPSLVPNSLLFLFLLVRYHDSISTHPFRCLAVVCPNDGLFFPFHSSLPFPFSFTSLTSIPFRSDRNQLLHSFC